MNPVPLTLTILTLNEADRIEHAIRSVPFADEVLVVDSGSTDETQGIAEKLGARVISHPFEGYVKQKQFALETASHEWVLCLDADEEVSSELAASIREALSAPSIDVDGFSFNRLNFYLGCPMRRAGWYPDPKLRLVRKSRARWSGVDPHDRLEVDGSTAWLKGDLHHHSYRDLAHHARKIAHFAPIWAEAALARGRRATQLDLLLRPLYYFLRRYLLGLGFLAGARGLLLCAMGAYYVFLKYACLREWSQQGTIPPR